MRRFAVPGLVALAAVLGAPAASSAAASTRVASPPLVKAAAKPEHWSMSVACTSARNCVAVGADVTTNRPLAERWNGARWAAADLRLPAGATIGFLTGVSCAAADRCVAVGVTGVTPAASSGTVAPLAESWNGTSWSAARPPAPPGSHGAELLGISCPTARTCVATGAYSAGNTAIGYAAVLTGGKWTAYKPPGLPASSSYYSALNSVSCMSAASCVAVGSYSMYSSPGGYPAGTAVAETWNGTRWSLAKLPAPPGGEYLWLYGVSCVRSKYCVATGGRYLPNNRSSGPLAEIWSAGKWRAAVPPGAGTDPSLFDVSCVSAASCLAVGSADTPTPGNSAFSDSWNGRAWTYVKMPTPSAGGGKNVTIAESDSCLSAADCVAVGSAGPAQLPAYGFSGFWNGRGWRLAAIG